MEENIVWRVRFCLLDCIATDGVVWASKADGVEAFLSFIGLIRN